MPLHTGAEDEAGETSDATGEESQSGALQPVPLQIGRAEEEAATGTDW